MTHGPALVTEGRVMFSGSFQRQTNSSYLDFCPALEKAFQNFNFEHFMLITKLSEAASFSYAISNSKENWYDPIMTIFMEVISLSCY